MAATMCMKMSGLSLHAPCRQTAPRQSFSSSLVGTRLTANQQSRTEVARGSLVVVAAQNSDKRIRTSERNRQYNKSRKSAVATRIKKVLKALEGLEIKAEEELVPVQKLLNEAYEEIDKAVVKGILHKNTGARRKSRIALARQRVLIANGLYTPASS